MADGIMAFWSAPLDDPAHAEHACRTALAMPAVEIDHKFLDEARLSRTESHAEPVLHSR